MPVITAILCALLIGAGLWGIFTVVGTVARGQKLPACVVDVAAVTLRKKQRCTFVVEFTANGEVLRLPTDDVLSCTLGSDAAARVLAKWQARDVQVVYDAAHPRRLCLVQRLPGAAAESLACLALGAALLAVLLA